MEQSKTKMEEILRVKFQTFDFSQVSSLLGKNTLNKKRLNQEEKCLQKIDF